MKILLTTFLLNIVIVFSSYANDRATVSKVVDKLLPSLISVTPWTLKNWNYVDVKDHFTIEKFIPENFYLDARLLRLKDTEIFLYVGFDTGVPLLDSDFCAYEMRGNLIRREIVDNEKKPLFLSNRMTRLISQNSNCSFKKFNDLNHAIRVEGYTREKLLELYQNFSDLILQCDDMKKFNYNFKDIKGMAYDFSKDDYVIWMPGDRGSTNSLTYHPESLKVTECSIGILD